jgi:GNAT superfamily N-acetyltransferase
VFPVLHELRPHLRFGDFFRIYKAARKADGYTIVASFEGDECAAVMGYRVLTDCVHGRHLYIDDLVTTGRHRGKGLGSALLKYAAIRGRALRCKTLRLSTGTENKDGMRFYEREGWTLRAVTFKKPLARHRMA